MERDAIKTFYIGYILFLFTLKALLLSMVCYNLHRLVERDAIKTFYIGYILFLFTLKALLLSMVCYII